MSPQLAAAANSGIQDSLLPVWPTAFGGEGSHHHHAWAKRPGRSRAAKITQGDLLLPLSRRGTAVVDLDLNPSGPDQISSQPKSHPPNGRRRSLGHRQPDVHCRWRRREMERRCPHALPPAEDCAAVAASPQGLRPALSSATAAAVGGDGGGGLRAVWTGTPRGRRSAATSGERGRGSGESGP